MAAETMPAEALDRVVGAIHDRLTDSDPPDCVDIYDLEATATQDLVSACGVYTADGEDWAWAVRLTPSAQVLQWERGDDPIGIRSAPEDPQIVVPCYRAPNPYGSPALWWLAASIASRDRQPPDPRRFERVGRWVLKGHVQAMLYGSDSEHRRAVQLVMLAPSCLMLTLDEVTRRARAELADAEAAHASAVERARVASQSIPERAHGEMGAADFRDACVAGFVRARILRAPDATARRVAKAKVALQLLGASNA